MTLERWQPGYPACASTPEDDGPNFVPPTIINTVGPHNRRLREAAAFSKVSRETADFHERRAYHHGLDTSAGLAHFQASKAYRNQEAVGALQEMFDQAGGQGIPPKAVMKAHKAAIGFHKKQAEKAGVDSPEGQAHVAALQTHMDGYNKAKQAHKESIAGKSGKQSPVPVPKKSEQPSEDIRQNLPPQPVSKLQQTAGAHAGKIRMSQREAGHDANCTPSALPSRVPNQLRKGDALAWRAKKPKPAEEGPLAAAPRAHGGGVHESRRRRSL